MINTPELVQLFGEIWNQGTGVYTMVVEETTQRPTPALRPTFCGTSGSFAESGEGKGTCRVRRALVEGERVLHPVSPCAGRTDEKTLSA